MTVDQAHEKIIDRIMDISEERGFVLSVLSHLDTVQKCQRMEQFLDYADSIGDKIDAQGATIAAINIDNGA